MSKPQVTITLGRTGQVVKRPGSLDGYRSDHGGGPLSPLSGTKRSIKDRLGNQSSMNKRQRKDGIKASDDDDLDGVPIRQDDLRFKLMRKNMSRRTLSNGGEIDIDLREKLSRTTQPPSRYDTREHVHEPVPLRRIPPTRSADDLLHMDSLRKSYSAWDLDRIRRRSPDRLVSTPRGVSPPRNIERRRQVRIRSPDRLVSTSRTLSPPRNMERRRQVRLVEASRPVVSSRTADASRSVVPTRTSDASRPIVSSRPVDYSRPVDTSRPSAYTSKDVCSDPRPMSYMAKSGVPVENAKPVARLPPSSASGLMPKTYPGGEHLTVGSLLGSLGLAKYAILFQAEEVDMTALKQMRDQDLKELGIPMGPRKKILLAVVPRSKRQP